jgi:hypothetical protein
MEVEENVKQIKGVKPIKRIKPIKRKVIKCVNRALNKASYFYSLLRSNK